MLCYHLGTKGNIHFLRGDLPVDLTRSAKCGVVIFKASMLNCRGGQSAMGICALYYICNLCGVMFCRDLCLIGGGVGVNLT